MIFIFYILAALLVWFSYKSFRGGLEYLRYFRDELSKPDSSFTPFVSVIAPCKGLDTGLRENLAALLTLDYPDFEIIFVVDDEDDQAVQAIREVMADYANSKLVVAARSTTSAQKAENLREAVLHADPQSEAFVFVDSDARPSKNWLRALIGPLEDQSIGATTGYRWFISEKRSFAGELRNMWNASIASALGPNENGNFCWGGSMAIRRETFETLKIRDIWANVVSDDFAVTKAMNENGLWIKFVPQALTPSIENCTFGELIEFTNRQMKITRVYAPRLWLMSMLGSFLFCLVISSAFSIIIVSSRNSAAVWVSIAVILAVTIFSVGKSILRLRAVKLALAGSDRVLAALDQQDLSQCTFWALTPFLFLYNCLNALFSRTIVWRGIEYQMVSETETRVLKQGE